MTPNMNQRAAFLAALTATDQVPAAERERNAIQSRRSYKARLKDERYRAWMEARAAYHNAVAADVRAIVARITDMPESPDREADHLATSRAMMAAYDRFMLLPLSGVDDAKERRVMIRRGRNAVVLCIGRDAYTAAERGWLAHIEANSARTGGRV